MATASPTYKGFNLDRRYGLLSLLYRGAIPGATALGANTAVTGVLVGTPVSAASPVDTIFISNTVANGDIALFVRAAGGANSEEAFRIDASARLVVFNEASADWDFRIESDGNANILSIDGGLNGGHGSVAIGQPATADSSLVVDRAAMTATASTVYATLVVNGTNAVTIPTGTTARVSSVHISEPNITATGTVTAAMSLYIAAAPTEGTSNYAQWIDAGALRLDGRLDMGVWADSTQAAVTAAGFAIQIAADTQNFSNGSSTLAIGAVVALGVATLTGDTATLTFTDAATLYIAGVPAASTNVAITNTALALWVDAGGVRFDGNVTCNLTLTAGADGVGAATEQLTSGGAGAEMTWAAAGSLLAYKDILGYHDPQDALDKMLNTSVADFRYLKGKWGPNGERWINTGDYETVYTGVVAEWAPWAMHSGGRILNPINTFGYTVLAIQAMHAEVDELRERVRVLEAARA